MKILLIGGNRGIANDILRDLSKKNHLLVLSRNKPKKIKTIFSYSHIDLCSEKSINKNIKLVKNFKANALIFCAAEIGQVNLTHKLNLNKLKNTLQVNFFSILPLLKSLLSQKNFYKVVFFSGGGAGSGFKKFQPYSLSKTLIVRLCENLSLEYPEKYFHVIAPGLVETKLMKESIRKGNEVLDKKKIIDSSYCLKLISFLLKNKDKRYSGKFIHVFDDYEDKNKFKNKDSYLLRRSN